MVFYIVQEGDNSPEVPGNGLIAIRLEEFINLSTHCPSHFNHRGMSAGNVDVILSFWRSVEGAHGVASQKFTRELFARLERHVPSSQIDI